VTWRRTPAHVPVPVQELDARLKGYYNLGGGPASAGGDVSVLKAEVRKCSSEGCGW
jgi:hypothetical protein